MNQYEEMIGEQARKRSRLVGVDYDDLIQEGRMAVILSLMGDFTPNELDIKNAMRRWIKAQKNAKTVYYPIREE